MFRTIHHIWRNKLNDYARTTCLSIVVGVLTGLAATLLKTLVHHGSAWLQHLNLESTTGGNLLMLIYPLIGILLTVLFVKYIIKGDIGHGIPGVLFAISRKDGYLPPSSTYSSVIASTLTVAFGGSVGLEAPIVTTGSAIGSNVGQKFHLPPRYIRLLIGCGAAGAIAGIFKAPLAGILFVVEVLMFELSKTTSIPLLLSSICASTVSYFLMGTKVQFAFKVTDVFTLDQIPFYVCLGIVCAFSSIYFLRATDKIEGLFTKIKPWHRICIGGAVLGALVFLFPPLYGEGYGLLTNLLHGKSDVLYQYSIFASLQSNVWVTIALLVALILLKAVATATTMGSGGVGGTFGPSLVLGGITGYFFALMANQMGLPAQSLPNFALVGMAGVMTGVMHAPLMATFLIAEITGGYALMAPLLITVVVSYLVVNPFEKHSIYARKLAKQGDLLTHNKDNSAWRLLNYRKIIENDFAIVHEGDHLRDLVNAIKGTKRNVFPVLDKDGIFKGVIHLDDVREIIFQPEHYDTITVDELTRKITNGDIVSIDAPPTEVVKKFKVGERYNLIVLDTDGRYLGVLSRANTFSAYRKFISETTTE